MLQKVDRDSKGIILKPADFVILETIEFKEISDGHEYVLAHSENGEALFYKININTIDKSRTYSKNFFNAKSNGYYSFPLIKKYIFVATEKVKQLSKPYQVHQVINSKKHRDVQFVGHRGFYSANLFSNAYYV